MIIIVDLIIIIAVNATERISCLCPWVKIVVG